MDRGAELRLAHALARAPADLTPFGVWLAARLPRIERVSPFRNPECGWRLAWCGRAVLRLRASPYDDLMPVVPWLVTDWRFALSLFGLTLWSWHRASRLRRRKHCMAGRLSGRNQRSGAWA